MRLCGISSSSRCGTSVSNEQKANFEKDFAKKTASRSDDDVRELITAANISNGIIPTYWNVIYENETYAGGLLSFVTVIPLSIM